MSVEYQSAIATIEAGNATGIYPDIPEVREVKSQETAYQDFMDDAMGYEDNSPLAAPHDGIVYEGDSATPDVFEAFTTGDSNLLGRIQPVAVELRVLLLNLAVGQALPVTEMEIIQVFNGIDFKSTATGNNPGSFNSPF